MLRNRTVLIALATLCAMFCWRVGLADTLVSEDFTGTTTNSPWYFYNGACLTAGTANVSGNLGTATGTDANGNTLYSFEGCVSDTYYTENLVGGYNGAKTASVAIGSSTALDPSGYGALRFTNGCINSGTTACSNGSGGGHNQNGAIISANTFSTGQGLDITFKTVTYRGDSGGANGDGADGMSFFLMDGSVSLTADPVENIGSYGGSLGYSCSNQNKGETEPYHGMVGAYLGLGIDEYGNFLNGTAKTNGETDGSWTNGNTDPNLSLPYLDDNTASGGLYKPNRIGLRGAGNIAWNWLTTNYSSQYPSTLTPAEQNQAVEYTCATGYLWDFSDVATGHSPTETKTTVNDYLAIPGAYKVISSKIGNEYSSGGYSRRPPGSTVASGDTGATPITYRLKITEDGILNLEYSYNGGAWTNVIQNRNIATSNGTVPGTVRFGFAGSSGGSTNIHEILCFKATPASAASSSTTVNQQQSSKVEAGAQAYFGYYDPTDWTGHVTANTLTDTNGVLTISGTANWDASCVLTGATTGKCAKTGQAAPFSAEAPSSRVILTWSDSASAGVPFEWANLSATETTALNAGDNNGSYRLSYLRGDRTQEIKTDGSGLFRVRDSVLSDVIDSSSTWVGPPSKSAYVSYESPATWRDRIDSTDATPENSGQTYTQYASSEATRQNVVYVGANDGLVHGFSAGSFDSTGATYNTTTNTGQEVLAYMPQGVLESIHSSTTSDIDFSNTQYAHAFYLDATPGTGDLFYGGTWHTWLVGGLGPGGSEVYALDITNPSTFVETNAGTLVKGDWTASTISCSGNTGCGSNLGQTWGTPVIRRLHNGDWGIIFGNGLQSSSGDAGIFIVTISSTGTQTVYYLSTGKAGGNGIANAMPMDMDGDHIVDYVYAGDALGNVWRFDLTSTDPTKWAVTPGPIFTTSSGQPITGAVYPAKVTGPTGTTFLMLYFGTGRKIPLTATTPTSYQSGTQSFYGVWDWNMSGWNSLNSTQYASLTATTVGTLLPTLTSPYTLGPSNLTSQTVTTDSAQDRLMSSVSQVCWAGTTSCGSSASSNTQFGWYLNFPGGNSGYGASTSEQLIYNPTAISTAIVFDTILPAIDSPLMCTPDQDQGWTYALNALSGGPVNSGANNASNFFNNGNTHTIALNTNASGNASEVTTYDNGTTNYYLIFQSTTGGPGTPQQITPPNNVSGYRETWVQLR